MSLAVGVEKEEGDWWGGGTQVSESAMNFCAEVGNVYYVW